VESTFLLLPHTYIDNVHELSVGMNSTIHIIYWDHQNNFEN